MNRFFYILILLLLSFLTNAQTLDDYKFRIDSFYHEANFKECIRLASKSINIKPTVHAYTYRALCYSELDQYQKSINDCSAMLAIKPDLSEKIWAHKTRGISYLNIKKYDLALKDFTEYEKYGTDSEVEMYLGYVYLLKGKHSFAIKQFNLVLQDYKLQIVRKIEAYDFLASCYIDLDSSEVANSFVTKGLALDSLSGRLWYTRGKVMYNKGNYTATINYCNKSLKLDSTEIHGLYFRALSEYFLKEYEGARNDLYLYKNKGGTLSDLSYWIGQAEEKLDNLPVALKYFRKYATENPKSSSAYNSLAWAMLKIKNYPEALQYANRALTLDPKNIDAIDTRGTIYYKLGEYNLAIKDFNSSSKRVPDYTNSFYFRGLCYLKLRDFKNACADWEKTLTDKDYQLLSDEKKPIELINEFCK